MMWKYIVIILLAFSCTDEERSLRVLDEEGYTQVVIDGHGWGCDDKDTYCTAFHAVGPRGNAVEGYVGCGMNTGCSKACTVRLR